MSNLIVTNTGLILTVLYQSADGTMLTKSLAGKEYWYDPKSGEIKEAREVVSID